MTRGFTKNRESYSFKGCKWLKEAGMDGITGSPDGGFYMSDCWVDMEVWTPFFDTRLGWWLARRGIRWRSKDTTLGELYGWMREKHGADA